MKNFIQPGDVVEVTAPDDTDHDGGLSGDGVLVGSLFGIAVTDFVAGGKVEIKTTGVYDLPKEPSQAWAQGVKVYWDDGNAYATTTSSTNKQIGVAILPVAGGAGDVIGRVRLTGGFTV